MTTEIPSNTTVAVAVRVLGIVSLLGENGSGSASRQFCGRSVLEQTLERVSRSTLDNVVVLAWDDQIDAIRKVIPQAVIRSTGARRPSFAMQRTSAALRWSDGWRGGLLGVCEFDRGFDAAAILAATNEHSCEQVMLVNPASVLIDPATIDGLTEHLAAQPEQPYAFAAGSPGSGAMLLKRTTIEELARQQRLPGTLLMYHPDRPIHDPLAKAFAMPVSPRTARSLVRVVADSSRQVHRLAQIDATSADDAVIKLEAHDGLDSLPREVILELTTRRQTRPAWMLPTIERPDLTINQAEAIFSQLAEADDIRITFGGVGDPLCHPQFDAILAAAKSAGIEALHVETDLLPDDAEQLDRLAASDLDVLSFHLPAATQQVYAELMGVDRMRDVLNNVKRLLVSHSRSLPIIVPLFTKCEQNLAEMEAWYDQWIRAVGTAAITGPSDLSGRVRFLGVSDMIAGGRKACRRLSSRITIRSDGSVVSCEEDVLAEQRCGTSDEIKMAWSDGLAMLRTLHRERRWDESAICRDCRMWDRP